MPAKANDVIPGITACYFTFGFFGAWYLNTTVQANSLGFSGKYLTVKDDREARKAAVFTAILATVAALVFFIPPMTARLLIPAEVAALGLPHQAEGAYAGIALYLLPTALVGMVLVGRHDRRAPLASRRDRTLQPRPDGIRPHFPRKTPRMGPRLNRPAATPRFVARYLARTLPHCLVFLPCRLQPPP
jgi:hypothetical protein